MIGSTISHYHILEKLGEGGMGVVYKAQDTKLERFVALKFLPAHATVNAETKARFQQEARAAAALNHPNICTIHGVEEENGNLFIVMEYIDGGTLRDKVPYARMEDAVSIAIQIGDALHEAHSKGIVHRDVKADNIMLTAKGQVKVMDFGLAKLKGTLKLTRTSSTVGTLAYMAPEQIQGGEVDQRSDIFSFGVLFFEMLTGKFPFRGEHEASLLYSIVNEEPESITKHLPEASAALQQIFDKALEKDPAMRYHSIDDMVVDLRRTKKQTSKVSRVMAAAPAAPAPAPQAAPPSGSASRPRTVIIAAGLILIGLAAAWFLFQKDVAPPFNDMKITRLTSDGKSSDVAISPDGRYVAYVRFDKERSNLWIRQVSTTNNIAISQPTENLLGALTFAPNGDFLYYLSITKGTGRADLYQVSILGGTPKKIMERVNSRISFSPDGSRFAFVTDSTEAKSILCIADADGSNPTKLLRRILPGHFDDLAWSPDGKYIGLIEGRSGSYMNHRLLIYNIADGSEIVPEGQHWLTLRSINWMEHSKGVIVAAADDQSTFDSPQLWYYPVKGGEARRLTNDLNGFSFSSMDRNSSHLVALEPESYATLSILPAGSSTPRALTEGAKRHDGMKGVRWFNDRQIVYTSPSSGYDNLWLIDAADGKEQQITNGSSVDRTPTPVPGTNTIIFSSNRGGAFNLWRSDVNGASVKRLTTGNYDIDPVVTPDGRWVLYGSYGDSASSIHRMTVDGDSDEVLTKRSITGFSLSPDGRSIAYLHFDDDQKQLLTVMDLSSRTVVSDMPYDEEQAVWTPDGRSFAYVKTKDGVSNLWAIPRSGGASKQLTFFTAGRIFDFDWSPDGRSLVVARGDHSTDIILMTDTQRLSP